MLQQAGSSSKQDYTHKQNLLHTTKQYKSITRLKVKPKLRYRHRLTQLKTQTQGKANAFY